MELQEQKWAERIHEDDDARDEIHKGVVQEC
jgi:hypothetical protein